MTISPQLLKILVCPVTKDKLIYDEDSNTLISLSAGLAYPIMDGIPIMLIDKAIKVSPKKLKDFLDREQGPIEVKSA